LKPASVAAFSAAGSANVTGVVSPIGIGRGQFLNSIVSIQALRGIAAISVALVHFNAVALMLVGSDAPLILYPLASGVDLFFVISGFVMVYSSEPLFAAPGGSTTFFIRRLARIVPLYWSTTAIAIPLMSLPVTWGTLVQSYFFIPYLQPNGNMVPLHGVGWTLNFEMFFYLTFAVAIFLPRRVAVPLLSAVLFGAVILGSLLSPSSAPLRYWSDPIILEFVFGMLIALVYRQQRTLLPMWARLCIITASATTVCFFAPRMPPSGYRALEWGLPAAMIVAASILGRQNVWRGLTATIAKELGDASYSIYLIHPLVGAAIFLLWHYNLGYLGYLDHRVLFVVRYAFIVAGFVFLIVLSMATYRYLEKPFTAFIRRRLERSRNGSAKSWPARL
jgi:exopolysaccharide production protein ExoZ